MLDELKIPMKKDIVNPKVSEANQRHVSLFSWVACLTCVLVGVLRLPFGFSYGDEGFHLASAARYLLGDRLFIDDHSTALRSFDVFTWPLMVVSPFDTVLFWRFCGYITGVGALAFACIAVGRILPRSVQTALFCGLVLFIPFNLPILFYDNLSQIFLLSAEACFVIAAGISARQPMRSFALSGISAIAFLCCAACYLPLLALLVFPAIALWFGRKNSTFRKMVFIWYGCLVVTGCATVACLLATHRLAQIVASVSDVAASPHYAMPFAQRIIFKLFHHDMWAGFGVCVLFFVPAFALSAINRKYRLPAIVVITAGLDSLLIMFLLHPGTGTLTFSPYLTMFNCAGVLLAVTLLLVAAIRGVNLRTVWPAIVGLALNLSATLIVVVSASEIATDIKQLNVCMWLFWPSIVTLAWDLGGRLDANSGLDANSDGLRVRQIVLLMIAWLVLFSGAHLWRWSYEDLAPYKLHAIFHSGKLRGIISTPEKVKTAEALVASVHRFAPNAKFLLSYGGSPYGQNFPALTYLTNTRPALYSSMVGDEFTPEPVFARWLEDAKQHGRVADVIVVCGEITQRDSSLPALLTSEYRPVDQMDGFVVYVPNGQK
jgi:hypothetical protein